MTDKSSVYLNFVINSGSFSKNTILSRDINRTEPIIKNGSKYKLRVLRAVVPTNSIPLFNWDDRQGATPFSMNLTHLGIDYETIMTNTPGALNNDIYHPGELLDSMNVALKASFDAIKAANPGIVSTTPPEIVLVPNTQTLRFLIPETFIGDGIDIYPSGNLETFFSFSFFYGAATPANRQWKLLFSVDPLRKNIQVYNGINYIMKTGDYPTLELFAQFQLLRLTTSLPIRDQLSGDRTSQTILQDLYTAADVTGSNIEIYVPTGEITEQDILTDDQISNISIKVEWVSFSQSTYPVRITEDQFFSTKLEFRPIDQDSEFSDPYRSITSAPGPSSSRRLVATY